MDKLLEHLDSNSFIKLSEVNLPIFIFFNNKRYKLANTKNGGLVLTKCELQKNSINKI